MTPRGLGNVYRTLIGIKQYESAEAARMLQIPLFLLLLMDYGFHAPTVSFPVAGTLMIEPTESESKQELDRFCEAMITIKLEIEEIMDGKVNVEDSVLKHAPHTMEMLANDDWLFNYSRQKAAYPLAWLRENKFWPSVRRVNDAYGDRNLVCSCAPVSDYA